jgi:hypothetical protein
VLAACQLEVAGVQEAVRRVIERPPERRAGAFTSTACNGAVMLCAPYVFVVITAEA